MTKIGIIGCGQIAKFHYEGYERAGAKIAHVADVRADAAQAVAQRYGAKCSTDYRKLLDDPGVELVSVCSIATTHKQICLDAIAAGKGIVCEKTLTDNADDSLELARAARRAGTFFATAYMKRFFPAAQQAKAMLADMGQIISIHARSWQPWDFWNTPVGSELRQHPSQLKQRYGGGVLVCAGSHVLDLIHFFGGRPRQVVGSLYTPEGMDIDIRADAMLWMQDGAMTMLECCWHPLKFGGYERNGWDERFEINTARGRLNLYTVLWNNYVNPALLVHEDAASGKTTEYRFPVVNPFDVEMKEMVDRFERGEPASPDTTDGYVVDEMIAAITHSSRENKIIEMNWRI